jgi:hypothetical protein
VGCRARSWCLVLQEVLLLPLLLAALLECCADHVCCCFVLQESEIAPIITGGAMNSCYMYAWLYVSLLAVLRSLHGCVQDELAWRTL